MIPYVNGYSAHTGPILDYASPRPRGKVRLPSRSRIEVRDERDGVIVTEWLEAKAAAMAALGVGVFTLILLPLATLSAVRHGGRMGLAAWLVTAGVPALVWAGEVVVFLAVINNTWRRTVLEARHDGLLLTFTAPFGHRRYEWGASQVEDVRMESTTTATDRNSLGELEIRLAALPLVKLFTDHPAAELDALAQRLRHAVGVREPTAAGAGKNASANGHE